MKAGLDNFQGSTSRYRSMARKVGSSGEVLLQLGQVKPFETLDDALSLRQGLRVSHSYRTKLAVECGLNARDGIFKHHTVLRCKAEVVGAL